MTTSKKIREVLLNKMAQPTIYKKIEVVRKIAGNSISKEVAVDIVASQEDIDVHSILKKEGRTQELDEFKDALSKFDFGNGQVKRKPEKDKDQKKETVEKSPYDYSLSKFNIDAELVADCKIQKPYRKAVSESLLTLETRIRNTLGLDETYYGEKLIAEAKAQNIFKRKLKAEEEGLYFMFMGAFKWLRNPTGHRKINYTKEDSIKIVMYTDYLIKLFDDLVNKRI